MVPTPRLRVGLVFPSGQGKGEAGGYPATRLPVVAMGLVPHIYRRACFSQRATPNSLPQGLAAVQRLPNFLWGVTRTP